MYTETTALLPQYHSRAGGQWHAKSVLHPQILHTAPGRKPAPLLQHNMHCLKSDAINDDLRSMYNPKFTQLPSR